MWDNLTETQKGAVGENLVASQLIVASGGRLSPFRAIADDGGIDLLVYDKQTGIAVPLQVKTRAKTLRKSPNAAHFQVRKATFSPGVNGCLLAVLVNAEASAVRFRCAWLVPLKQLKSVAGNRKATLVIRPSSADASNDKFTKFRCPTPATVVKSIIAICEGGVE